MMRTPTSALRRAFPILLLLAIVSGCVGEPERDVKLLGGPEQTAPSEGAGLEQESSRTQPSNSNVTQPAVQNESITLRLYLFKGTVTGTSSPKGPGESGTLANAAPAKTEKFLVPVNVTELGLGASACGISYFRIEIFGPGGNSASRTRNVLIVGQSGLPSSLCPWISPGEFTDFQKPVQPGEYEVQYQVAGTIDVELEVLGKASPDASGDLERRDGMRA